ncbi:MAG: hypothetical protein BAA04_00315 [Firmicutes bacterium ZCTH02-B6]|nr:MAG: hypothetical protein BAA04_00315 [Firmicutes bacterium ZCTH02-B6]
MPRALRILLIEENSDDVNLIIGQLERHGFEPSHRQVEDRSTLQSALAEQNWDVVVCCDGVPGLSPHAAFTMVSEADGHLPFIVYGQHGGEQNAQRVMPPGAHGFVSKGAVERLAPTIERALDQAARRWQPPLETLVGVRVLLVDDHRDLLEAMAEVLEWEGCHVTAKASPEEALAHLEENPPPDVIICDLSLPGMDGYEFLRRARALPGMERVPALALSGLVEAPSSARFQEAGFHACLVKPVAFDELRETLLRALSAEGRGGNGETPVGNGHRMN